MKYLPTQQLVIFCVVVANASSAMALAFYDDERARISNQRTAVEAVFTRDAAACYKKFVVNRCLDGVNDRRSAATADLRRQEILLDDQERKFKGAQQIKKTEEKTSSEKQQEEDKKRAKASKEFNERMARDQERNAARESAQASGKPGMYAANRRIISQQEKAVSRAARQTAAAEALKKYNQRIKNTKEREVRLANEKASLTKPSAQPLPVPN